MSNETHVIFGTGPLAQAILQELLRQGKPVRLVNRTGRRPNAVPDTVEVIGTELYDPQQVKQVAQGAAVVYQCAQPTYTEWVTQWPLLMKSILTGLSGAQTKLIMGDNLYMYGDTDGQPIHEGLSYAAHTRKGLARKQVAEMTLEAHRTGAVPVAIGRGSDFYGRGVRNSLSGERVFEPALQGKAAQLAGNLDLPHTLTYIEDFGKALVILGEREEALGQVWHVPNPPTLTQRQWATLVYKEAGQPFKVSSLNKLMVNVGGLFMPVAREMAEMMYEFEKPYIVDSSKFVRAFGDHSTPHTEAIKATVAWYRDQVSVQQAGASMPKRVTT